MRGLGTIINTISIIAGGGLGLLIKNGVSENMKKTLIQACGLASLFIGVSGTLQNMSSISNNTLSFSNSVLLVCSLAIGSFIGVLLKIEDRLDNIGAKLQTIAKAQSDNQFINAFVTVSLIVCVGAMAIMGSIEDGLSGNYSTLLTKSILDGIIALVFASSLGIGVLFSSVSVLVYQGAITLLAVFIAPHLSDVMITELSMVGSSLIFCVGTNLLLDKKIHVGNMLPSIFVPIIYELLKLLI